jgi:hypothetical protein
MNPHGRRTKLTDADALAIRVLATTTALPYREIARKFGVTIGAVSGICRGLLRKRAGGVYLTGRRAGVPSGPVPRAIETPRGPMTIASLATLVGMSEPGMRCRIRRGLAGADLLAPAHCAPRCAYGSGRMAE